MLPTGQEPARKCHLVALCNAGSYLRASSDLAALQICCPQVKSLLENVTLLHYAMMVVVYVLPQIWQPIKCVAHRSRACSKMSPCCIMRCWQLCTCFLRSGSPSNVLPTGQDPARKCHCVALCNDGSCLRASSDLAAPQMCCPQVKILLENVTLLHYAMLVVYVIPQIWQPFEFVAHR